MVEAYDHLILSASPQDYRHSRSTYRNTPFARLLPEEGELINDLEELAFVMGSLALNARTVGLPHLRYGMEGYRAVTVACTERLDEFDDGEKIARTMPVFFDELAKALRHHVDGQHQAVQGWNKLFYSPRARNIPPAGAMLDFLTAHVRYDLAVTLLRTETEDRHETDYTQRINTILTDVARGMVDSYATFHAPLRRLGVGAVCLELALQELFTARDEAWTSFKQLSAASDLHEYATIRRSMRQRTEERLMSSNPVAGMALRIMTRVPEGVWHNDRLALGHI